MISRRLKYVLGGGSEKFFKSLVGSLSYFVELSVSLVFGFVFFVM